MTPLLMCAVGLVVCFRANIWNIGAEGQFVMGAIRGMGGIAGWSRDRILVPDSCIACWHCWRCDLGAVVALLRDRFNANEILVSLMLVYVAQFWFVLCAGPMQDPEGLGFPQSPLFAAVASMPSMISGTRLNLGFGFAVLAAVLVQIMMARMFIGFQIKVSGMAPMAAKYAGFRPRRLIWLSMLISGALAGLAGICEVAGPVGQLSLNISPGYGFAAIIVAFVGRLSPLGCIPAAFVMALFYLGGELGQSRLGLPSSITGVYQGMVLFFLLICDVWIVFKPRWVGFASGSRK